MSNTVEPLLSATDMTPQYPSTASSLSEERLKPNHKLPSTPRLTALTLSLFGLFSSLILLGLSAAIVSYDRSKEAHTGHTEVRYPYTYQNVTRNETGFINNLPELNNENGFVTSLGVSAYCVVLYILLAAALWIPADTSPFMRMNTLGLVLSFSLIALASVAHIGSAAYNIAEDNRSNNITTKDLHDFRNGTFKGESAPASWNCQLYTFATEPDRRGELNQLCSEAKAALAFTVLCSLVALWVSAIMAYFLLCMRRRRIAAISQAHELEQDQTGVPLGFVSTTTK